MRLIEGVLGNFDTLISPQELMLRTSVPLTQPPAPGREVRVFLRGFDIGYYQDDRHVNKVSIALEAYSFGNVSQVDVVARITLRDIDWVYTPIRVEVFFTLAVE